MKFVNLFLQPLIGSSVFWTDTKKVCSGLRPIIPSSFEGNTLEVFPDPGRPQIAIAFDIDFFIFR